MFKKRKKSLSGPGFLFGALVGGLIGGIAALLFAPKSGEEMREDIAEQYHKASSEAADLMDSARSHSKEKIERAKEIAEEAKDAASKYWENRGNDEQP
jgi:gas vesicle protein